MMRKLFKNFLRPLAFALTLTMLALSFFACKNGDGSETTLTIDPKEIELFVGETFELTATASDHSSIVWQSENEAVATVSDNGTVKGIAAGATVIKAQSGEKTAECKVAVKESAKPEAKNTFSGGIGVTELFSGDRIKILPALKIEGVNVDKEILVNYVSSDESVLKYENGELIAVNAGTATITAHCTYQGNDFTDRKTVSVKAVSQPTAVLTDRTGNPVPATLLLINDIPVSEQLAVKYYSGMSVKLYKLIYLETKNGEATFGLVQSNTTSGESVQAGKLRLALKNGVSVSLLSGETVAATLDNGVTQPANITGKIMIGDSLYEINGIAAFVKDKNTYTDFTELESSAKLGNYLSYAFSANGGLELDHSVTYHSAPSVKLTLPVGYSYLHLSDLMGNVEKYGLTSGSKITFKIRFDGEPKTAGTNYYAVGRITTRNGKAIFSSNDVLTYADARTYVSSGNTEWRDVTYVLNEESFPLVDLGLQFSGNSAASERYVYIACIQILNPAQVDYSVDFSNAVEWDNTGRNLNADWWGYSLGVANAFESGKAPEIIANAYYNTYKTELNSSVQIAAPTLSGIVRKVVLQNSSCKFTNEMKRVVYSGKKKMRVRVYMEATGNLPSDSSVTALTFLRQGTNAGYGFSSANLKTVYSNVWTELIYDVPQEYLQTDLLTVAFNMKNYAECEENVQVRFYLGSIAFV